MKRFKSSSKETGIVPPTRINKASSFGIFLLGSKILVGDDSGDRIEVPGGKFESCDGKRPALALKRETGQEVGLKFLYRRILAQPLVFATGVDIHTLVEEPAPDTRVDLRFFFLLEALNEDVYEVSPKELRNPRFMELEEVMAKKRGVEMRTAVGCALDMFTAAGHLPSPNINAWAPEPDVDVQHIFSRMKAIGFSDNVAGYYSRPLKTQTNMAQEFHPQPELVTRQALYA